jgi:hypothetical protein
MGHLEEGRSITQFGSSNRFKYSTGLFGSTGLQ